MIQSPSSRVRADERGVTLVELLVVLVLFSVVGGIVTAGIVAAFRSAFETHTRIEARQELELTAQQLARILRSAEALLMVEIDSASLDPAMNIGARLSSATLDDDLFFGVESGTDANRLIECRGDVSCLTDPDASQRQLIALVGNDVTQPATEAVFTYLDQDDNEVSPGSARVVRIRLLRELEGDRNPVVVETSVTVRRVRYVETS